MPFLQSSEIRTVITSHLLFFGGKKKKSPPTPLLLILINHNAYKPKEEMYPEISNTVSILLFKQIDLSTCLGKKKKKTSALWLLNEFYLAFLQNKQKSTVKSYGFLHCYWTLWSVFCFCSLILCLIPWGTLGLACSYILGNGACLQSHAYILLLRVVVLFWSGLWIWSSSGPFATNPCRSRNPISLSSFRFPSNVYFD